MLKSWQNPQCSAELRQDVLPEGAVIVLLLQIAIHAFRVDVTTIFLIQYDILEIQKSHLFHKGSIASEPLG